MAVSVKERNLIREAAEQLTTALREVPFLARTSLRQESTRGDSRLDFILTVRSESINRRLVCEVKSSGQPRVAREACLNLVDLRAIGQARLSGLHCPVYRARRGGNL